MAYFEQAVSALYATPYGLTRLSNSKQEPENPLHWLEPLLRIRKVPCLNLGILVSAKSTSIHSLPNLSFAITSLFNTV